MIDLEKHLNQINELLAQIYYITQNQATVLLESSNDTQVIEILEGMFQYKEELMNDLAQVELTFQEDYYKKREELERTGRLGKLKIMIEEIFKVKNKIVELEQKNVILMQTRATKNVEKVQIPKQPQKIIESYKKHSKMNKI